MKVWPTVVHFYPFRIEYPTLSSETERNSDSTKKANSEFHQAVQLFKCFIKWNIAQIQLNI